MNLYPLSELRILAETYCEAEGLTPAVLGQRMGINDKIFPRLLEGKGCTAANAEKASEWFAANWPRGIAWPLSAAEQAA